MFCCTNCFADIEIKGIIEGIGPKKKLGNCDFCGSKRVPIFDIETNSALTELFDGLVDIYTPAGFSQRKYRSFEKYFSVKVEYF